MFPPPKCFTHRFASAIRISHLLFVGGKAPRLVLAPWCDRGGMCDKNDGHTSQRSHHYCQNHMSCMALMIYLSSHKHPHAACHIIRAVILIPPFFPFALFDVKSLFVNNVAPTPHVCFCKIPSKCFVKFALL